MANRFDPGTGTYVCKGLSLPLTRTNAGATTYIYAGNNVLAEYLGNASPQYPGREYFYASNKLIGGTISNNVVNYYHQDHQSIRIRTNADGTWAYYNTRAEGASPKPPAPPHRQPSTIIQTTSAPAAS